MKRFWFFILVGLSAHASAATYVASSCSSSDVSAAIAKAIDGDTVNIPAGNCTWSSAVTVSNGISVIGAGIGVTNITNGGFTVRAPSGSSWRIAQMTLSRTSGFNVSSNSKKWRIDHIRFYRVQGFTQNRIIWIQPTGTDFTAGVIDHCIFDDPQSIQVHYRGSQSDGGNSSYIRPIDLGGSDAVYIEDSQFNHVKLVVSNPVTDCEGGGRLVFRYNTVVNSYTEMHDAIIGGLRGCRKWETYNNTYQTTYASGQCGYIGVRGGTGVVFNNTFKNATDCPPIQLAHYRSYQTGGDPWNNLCSRTSGRACLGSASTYPRSCSSDADCGGTAGSCVDKDGSAASPNGYLCRDQIGADGNSSQVSLPALFWNNKYSSGAIVDPSINSGNSYLLKNRDFCTSNDVMPGSCNGITTRYTPYTYPHPLTLANVELPSAIAPPGNLR